LIEPQTCTLGLTSDLRLCKIGPLFGSSACLNDPRCWNAPAKRRCDSAAVVRAHDSTRACAHRLHEATRASRQGARWPTVRMRMRAHRWVRLSVRVRVLAMEGGGVRACTRPCTCECACAGRRHGRGGKWAEGRREPSPGADVGVTSKTWPIASSSASWRPGRCGPAPSKASS
jgi:hypothetical protein